MFKLNLSVTAHQLTVDAAKAEMLYLAQRPEASDEEKLLAHATNSVLGLWEAQAKLPEDERLGNAHVLPWSQVQLSPGKSFAMDMIRLLKSMEGQVFENDLIVTVTKDGVVIIVKVDNKVENKVIVRIPSRNDYNFMPVGQDGMPIPPAKSLAEAVDYLK